MNQQTIDIATELAGMERRCLPNRRRVKDEDARRKNGTRPRLDGLDCISVGWICNVLLGTFGRYAANERRLAMTSETDRLAIELAGTQLDCGPEHGKGKYGLPAPEWCSRCHGTGHLLDASVLTKALATELAGKRCPRLGDEVHRGPKILPTDPEPCLFCHGIGYLFPDAVRMPCCQIHQKFENAPYGTSFRNMSCAEAGCPGWTASRDFVTWCWALHNAGYQVVMDLDLALFVFVFSREPVPEGVEPKHWVDAEALLTALARKE